MAREPWLQGTKGLKGFSLISRHILFLATQVANRIEKTDLKLVCAFRMAAIDIRHNRFHEAASRIRQDLDKSGEHSQLLRSFILEIDNSSNVG